MLSFFSRGAKPRSFSLFVRPRFSRLFRRPSFGFVYWTTIAAMVIFPTYVLYTAFHAEETGSQAKAHSQDTLARRAVSRARFSLLPFIFGAQTYSLQQKALCQQPRPTAKGNPTQSLSALKCITWTICHPWACVIPIGWTRWSAL